MRPSPPVRLDAEVIELLRDSPELLAIADAITATQAAPATRRRATRLAAVAAVLGLAVALALVSPWSGRGSLVDRALAAIGSGAVIHVVETRDLSDQTLVDLRTGAESPVAQTRELWFDGERGLLRSVQRVGGAVTGEVLETPKGSWTEVRARLHLRVDRGASGRGDEGPGQLQPERSERDDAPSRSRAAAGPRSRRWPGS